MWEQTLVSRLSTLSRPCSTIERVEYHSNALKIFPHQIQHVNQYNIPQLFHKGRNFFKHTVLKEGALEVLQNCTSVRIQLRRGVPP